MRGGRGFRGFEDVVGLGQKREGRPRKAVGDADGVKCGLQVPWEDSVFLCGWLTVDTGRGGGVGYQLAGMLGPIFPLGFVALLPGLSSFLFLVAQLSSAAGNILSLQNRNLTSIFLTLRPGGHPSPPTPNAVCLMSVWSPQGNCSGQL